MWKWQKDPEARIHWENGKNMALDSKTGRCTVVLPPHLPAWNKDVMPGAKATILGPWAHK